MHAIRVVGQSAVSCLRIWARHQPGVAEGFAMFAQTLLDGGFHGRHPRMAVANPFTILT